MHDDLEEDGECDETSIRPADYLPREPIEEPNIFIDNWRRADSLAERAGTVKVVLVSIDVAVCWDRVFAIHCLRGQVCTVSWDSRIINKSDVRQTVCRAVVAQEVKEADCTADTSCCDKSGLLA